MFNFLLGKRGKSSTTSTNGASESRTVPKQLISKVLVLHTSLYDKGEDKKLRPIDAQSRQKMDDVLCDYDAGKKDAEDLARCIIKVMFEGESFSHGPRWCYNGIDSTETQRDDTSISFATKCSYEYDWKDISSEARSAATIKIYFDRKEVHLLDYNYYVAG